MTFIARLFELADYATIAAWAATVGASIPSQGSLPATGVVATSGGQPVAAAFLKKISNPVAKVEFIYVKPTMSDSDKKNAKAEVVEMIYQKAREQKFLKVELPEQDKDLAVKFSGLGFSGGFKTFTYPSH